MGWGRTTGIGGVIALVLALAQAEVVEGVLDGPGPPEGLHGFDQPVLDWFVAHRTSWATVMATLLAAAGGTVAMAAVAVAAVLVLLWRRRWWPAAVVAVTSAGGGLLALGFKHLYERHRPPAVDQVIHYPGYALPSGHAVGTTVVLGVVAAVIAVSVRPWAAKVAAVATASLLALLVGVSRLYLAAHWLTDVVTGWLLGGACLALAVTVLMLPAVRNRARYPVTDRTSQTTTSPRS
jgi:membrane-associated phospholipid phosphatase